jgi:hypothetical protein
MYVSSLFFSVSLLAALASCTPATLYRGDGNAPATAKAAGGLKAKGYGRSDAVVPSQATLFQHVSKDWGKVSPMKDPFISTSSSKAVSQGDAASSSNYVYTIDSSKITTKIWNCQGEYDEAKKDYPHAEESEYSVEGIIPWVCLFSPENSNFCQKCMLIN